MKKEILAGGFEKVKCQHCNGTGKCNCAVCHKESSEKSGIQEPKGKEFFYYCNKCNGYGFLLMDLSGNIITIEEKESVETPERINCEHCRGTGKCDCWDCAKFDYQSVEEYLKDKGQGIQTECKICGGYGFLLMDMDGKVKRTIDREILKSERKKFQEVKRRTRKRKKEIKEKFFEDFKQYVEKVKFELEENTIRFRAYLNWETRQNIERGLELSQKVFQIMDKEDNLDKKIFLCEVINEILLTSWVYNGPDIISHYSYADKWSKSYMNLTDEFFHIRQKYICEILGISKESYQSLLKRIPRVRDPIKNKVKKWDEIDDILIPKEEAKGYFREYEVIQECELCEEVVYMLTKCGCCWRVVGLSEKNFTPHPCYDVELLMCKECAEFIRKEIRIK